MTAVPSAALPPFLSAMSPAVFESENYVVLDFETDTSGGRFGVATEPRNGLLLACYSLGPAHPGYAGNPGRPGGGAQFAPISAWGDEFSQAGLLDAISRADFIVAHSAKYELGWLRRCGLNLRSVLAFDTRLAEYVLFGNLSASGAGRNLSLDACCRRRGWEGKDPVTDVLIKHGVNPTELPRPWLEGRCKQDVITTERLFRHQRSALLRSGRLAVQYTRCLLTPVLADMEFAGMCLDAARVEQAHAQTREEALRLQAQLAALAPDVNMRSVDQVGELVYTKLGFAEKRRPSGEAIRTESGKRCVDQKTLGTLKATTAAQREFLTLKKSLGKVQALLSKNLEFFVGVVREKGGRFGAEFNQMVTATHRLSSSGIRQEFALFGGSEKSVQFQNLPRSLRRLFRARTPGWLLWDADAPQLEFRVAVELADDERGRQDIACGHDVHRFTASVLNGVPEGQVTAEQRQAAKADTFKPLYGGQRGTRAQERYYAAFRERYKGINSTQRGWLREVLQTKRLITPWGLRYYWPEARIGSDGYCSATSSVFNYPVQALATAEIIPIVLVFMWHRTAHLAESVLLVNTVHDSIVAEVAPSSAQELSAIAKRCFTEDVFAYLAAVYGLHWRGALGCAIKVGEFWGDGDEDIFNITPEQLASRQEKADE